MWPSSILDGDIETNFNLFVYFFRGSEFLWSAFGRHENSDPRKWINKKIEIRLNLTSWNALWSHNVSHRRQKPERIEISISSSVYRYRVGWIQNWLQIEQHYSDSVSSISSVKKFTGKYYHSIGCFFHLVSFSLFDRRDSDKKEKINISLLSGCCKWTHITWP